MKESDFTSDQLLSQLFIFFEDLLVFDKKWKLSWRLILFSLAKDNSAFVNDDDKINNKKKKKKKPTEKSDM